MKIKPSLVLGLLLISLGGLILALSFFPVFKNEVSYQIRQSQHTPQPEIIPVSADFGIVIPKIAANSPIIAQVNPFNEQEYQTALSKGVAHAKNTSLPGEPGNIFLFSHSSADFLHAQIYNSIFYLLSKLEPGDEIKIYYKQTIYLYKVTEKKTVNSDAVDYLKSKTSDETLTLMTCWPPGTSIKRLIVQASRVQ